MNKFWMCLVDKPGGGTYKRYASYDQAKAEAARLYESGAAERVVILEATDVAMQEPRPRRACTVKISDEDDIPF